MCSNVNRTIDNGSSGFVYTPEEAWGYLRDDGSLAGNTSLLDDYKTQVKVVRSSDDIELDKRQAMPGKTSLAVTASAASVDLSFKGMSTLLLGCTVAHTRVGCVHLWRLWPTLWSSKSQAGQSRSCRSQYDGVFQCEISELMKRASGKQMVYCSTPLVDLMRRWSII